MFLSIWKTKTDSSSPTARFHIEGYATPSRLDKVINGAGLLFYVTEDIPYSLLNSDVSTGSFFVELNLRKKKWLLRCSYNSHKNQVSNHLTKIGRNIDAFSSNYDNLLFLVDFSIEPTELPMKYFCQIYNCKNNIKDKTCCKNPKSQSALTL